MSDVRPQNHFALATLATAAMGYSRKYRKRYAAIMRDLLDLDMELRKKRIVWSEKKYRELHSNMWEERFEEAEE